MGVEDPVVVRAAATAITPSQDPKLLKTLARGYYWQHLLDTGRPRMLPRSPSGKSSTG